MCSPEFTPVRPWRGVASGGRSRDKNTNGEDVDETALTTARVSSTGRKPREGDGWLWGRTRRAVGAEKRQRWMAPRDSPATAGNRRGDDGTRDVGAACVVVAARGEQGRWHLDG
ncbi:hypothetical protein E2562_035010 [Oryza meyeriana var. granulata]|uniref:DUF834 domain-containing protein n=1 Tax=Oryza meyeriana var. granulata TaxID=110450 RepID=A0A6G1ESL1_9ORYZ|nr:hypothetical protein E2562_035010 [Oryza meyeriana var. granulata]